MARLDFAVSERPVDNRPVPAGPDAVPPVGGWRRVVAETLNGGRGALIFPVLVAAALILFPVASQNAFWIRNISLIAILALATSGVNLSFGYAGEVQFGQVFMFALGAYVSVIVGSHTTGEIIPLLLLGGVVAAVGGGLVAIPALRFGGWSLALLSFFLVITIPDLTYIFSDQTGGFNGFVNIPTPTLFGASLGTTGLYEVCIVVLIVWLALFRNLVTSRYGVIFRTMRQSEVLTNSLGFSKFGIKLLAYTLGAFPAGVAGCLYAFVTLVLTPTAFSFALAIALVAASIVGGTESIYGVVVAAAILQLGPQQSVSFQKYAPIVYGIFLVVAAILLRQGLSGVGKSVARRISRRLGWPARGGTPVRREDATGAGGSPSPGEVRLGPLDGAELALSDVAKSYGGTRALDGVTFTVRPGIVTGLIGANGSGKTTLLNVICGYVKADHGSVRKADTVFTRLPPRRIARLGIGRTFQTPTLPAGVSVLDVVASGRFHLDPCGVAASMLRLPRYWKTRRTDRAAALELLRLVGLADLAGEEAAELPLGLRRLVEVARALCSRPAVLLLDEPASGLSVVELGRLARVIRAAAEAGAAVLLIEHNFDFVTTVCHTIHVLDFGAVIASGSPEEIAHDPRVIESYLGKSPEAATIMSEGEEIESVLTVAAPRSPAERPGPGTSPEARHLVLAASDLVSGYGDLQVLRGLSIDLRAGQVEVLLGRNGAGKTTLLSTLSGQLSLWQGSIRLDGKDISRSPDYSRARSGIALVQEGKRIFRERTVFENLMLGTFAGHLPRKERRDRCSEIIEQFPALVKAAGRQAGGLSGGQQQMLAIGQALVSRPRVLILDEPSAGLAPSVVTEVFNSLRELTVTSDITILLAEQLAQNALAIADHVSVMDAGQVVASGPPEDFSDMHELEEAYFGGSRQEPAGALGDRGTQP